MASTRKTTRRKLPGGPLDWECSKQIGYLRVQFLDAALKLNPKIQTELRRLVPGTEDKWRWLVPRGMEGAADNVRFMALMVWARRYNLQDDWCLEALWNAVEDPRLIYFDIYDPRVRAKLPLKIILADRPVETPPANAPPLPVDGLTWNPSRMSRKVMEARYQRYLDKVEDAYKFAGYKPARERRESAHLLWLAGYQVCGWSKNAIAEAISKDRAAVIHAINKLAGEIELSLRPAAANARTWTAKRIGAALLPVT